jgi:hypothetical protein
MENPSYNIIFVKLSEGIAELGQVLAPASAGEADHAEIDQLAELRRFVEETTAQEPLSFTTV